MADKLEEPEGSPRSIAEAIQRLRAEADECRERARLFDTQIAQRTNWIRENQQRASDLMLAISALEGPGAKSPASPGPSRELSERPMNGSSQPTSQATPDDGVGSE